MRLSSSFFHNVLASITAASDTPEPTVTEVESDIAVITSRAQSLYDAIYNFPDTGGSLTNALSIHFDVNNLCTSIEKATIRVKRIKPVPISLADGEVLLAAMQIVKPIIIDGVIQIIAKKPAFQSLAIGAAVHVIKEDLNNLNTSILHFGVAMISIAPSELVDCAHSIKAEVDAALEKAILAYS